MKLLNSLLAVLCFTFIICSFTLAQNSTNNITVEEEKELLTTVPYCFNFTWLGPRYDNSTEYNVTCQEHKEETSAKGVPCADPFVISYDGTLPDINYLWENYKTDVVCRQAKGDSCIKWTYYFDNKPVNVTRFCGRVFESNGKTIRSGCYNQNVGGYKVEFCSCQSQTGGFKPCNNAESFKAFKTGLIAIAFSIFSLTMLL